MVIEKKCQCCGKTFRATRASNVFCSNACRQRYRYFHSNPFFKKRCLYCGKEFETRSNCKVYCCDTCARKGLKKKYREETFNPKQICEYCGQEFEHDRKVKYCSKKCRNAANSEARLRRKYVKCAFCGSYFRYKAGVKHCHIDCTNSALRKYMGYDMKEQVVTNAADELVKALIEYQNAVHAVPRSKSDLQFAARDMYIKLCRFCNLYDLNKRGKSGND